MKKILIGLGFAAISTFVYADEIVVAQEPLINPEVIAITDEVTDDESITFDNDESVVFDFNNVGGEYGIVATSGLAPDEVNLADLPGETGIEATSGLGSDNALSDSSGNLNVIASFDDLELFLLSNEPDSSGKFQAIDAPLGLIKRSPTN